MDVVEHSCGKLFGSSEVLDRLDFQITFAFSTNLHNDFNRLVVGPVFTRRRGFLYPIGVFAGLSQIWRRKRRFRFCIATADGLLFTDLPTIAVDQLEREALTDQQCTTINGLGDLDRRRSRLGLVFVVEHSSTFSASGLGRILLVGYRCRELVVIGPVAYLHRGNDIGSLGPRARAIRKVGNLVNTVRVGFARVIVGKRCLGEFCFAVFIGVHVVERRRAFIAGGRRELERLPLQGNAAIHGFGQTKLELARSLLVLVVEQCSRILSVNRRRSLFVVNINILNRRRLQRAVAVVGANRYLGNNITGHGPANRCGRCFVDAVFIRFAGIAQRVGDLTEFGRIRTNRFTSRHRRQRGVASFQASA